MITDLMQPAQFQSLLLAWFDQFGRKHLPWQQNKTPYRVWISEVMLQQTQVTTVIPYFNRFIEQFPNVATLAFAPEDAVLHCWAGLGYYSRARNLHRAAKMIMTDFQGKFPSKLDDLQQLPGIGQSTAGAILAIAFNQQATILDGNVKRVLARLHAITGPINEKIVENQLWSLATNYTPKERCADYTQAMMDLGATLCVRRNPQCHLCPFNHDCAGYRQGIANRLPQKKAAKKLPVRQATFLLIKKQSAILLLKRPSTGIWGGLWSCPEMEGKPENDAINFFCAKQFDMKKVACKKLPSFRHTFTHYHLDIFPILIEIKKMPVKNIEEKQQIWYNLHQVTAVGIPKPVQTLLRGLASHASSTLLKVK